MATRLAQFWMVLCLPTLLNGFLVANPVIIHPRPSYSLPTVLKATSTTVNDVLTLARQIEDRVAAGRDPEDLLCSLEELNAVNEPNRSPLFLGEWHVWYTNCPPPSNGQLGPFQGSAGQVIQDSSTRSYQNLLAVPPNDWLTATLEGLWEDWDGVYLDNAVSTQSLTNKDWGAAHWKVTFLRLKIALLGYTVFNKEFPPRTARVWRTTYLDDEIRVVRAGKTGRREDEVVFYTKRTPKPTLATTT